MGKHLSVLLLCFMLAANVLNAQDGRSSAKIEEQEQNIQENEAALQKELDTVQKQEQQSVPAQTKQVLKNMPGSSDIPLQKYDTTAIVGVPNTAPSTTKPAPVLTGDLDEDAPEGTEDFTPDLESNLQPVENPQDAALLTPAPNNAEALAAQEKAPAKQSKKKKQEFKLAASESDLVEKIPDGTLAVYIDIEDAFNKNPWTMQARKNIKLDLETKQIEYAQLKDQLKELRLKESNLTQEMAYYKPFYEKLEYIEPDEKTCFPKTSKDKLSDILNTITFCACDTRVSSPENTPQKMDQIKSAIRDTKKAIIDKEAFLLNYRELSKEEIISRQDFIVQEILKEIYNGIKEYAALRNIGIVVDKKDLIYGKPLNVTPEFVKWMKSYHKKYLKQNGDIL